MWQDLVRLLKEEIDRNVPVKREMGQIRRQQLPKKIKRMIRNRSRAWKRYQQFSSGENFSRYKKLRNEINRAIRHVENSTRKKIIKGFKGNPKKFYGYMRSLQTIKDGVTTLMNDRGKMTTTDLDTAELLASYFQEVYTTEDTTVMPEVEQSNFN